MKRIRALIACSLVGSLWLASCSSTNKKGAIPSGDAGEAGEPGGGTAGAGAHAGAGHAGAAFGGATGEAGESALAGQAGSLTEGGAGGALSEGGSGGAPLACFDQGVSAAGATGIDVSEGGAGSGLHFAFSCNALKDALAAKYDPDSQKITLNAAALGAVAGGTFTYYYDWYDGESTSQGCGTQALDVVGSEIQLPISTGVHTPTQIWIPELKAHDECGNEAELSTHGEPGFCFNLTVHNDVDTWTVDCFEGNCYNGCR